MNTQKSLCERSIDTQVVIDRIQEMQVGDKIPYAEIWDMIGRNAPGILRSAREFCEREYGIFTSTVRGVGVQRVSHAQTVQSAPIETRTRIRRASRRLIKKLGRTDDSQLSRDDIQAKNASIALFENLRHFTSGKVTEIAVVERKDAKTISVGNVLEITKKAS